MPEIKVEDAKKELQGIVEQKKAADAKAKEATLSVEQKAALAEKQKQDKEAQDAAVKAAQADDAILAKKEEERTTEEKERAKVVLEERRVKEEATLTADEKEKRVKAGIQKRMDEMSNDLKQFKDQSSKEAEALKKQIALLKTENESLSKKIVAPAKKTDTESVLAAQEKQRIQKYLDDDAALPREQRREMSKDELETWLLEDVVAAQEWIAERQMRRRDERREDRGDLGKKEHIRDIEEQQAESSARVLIKHPELDTSKRVAELKAQGKSDEEIRKTLCSENEKFRIAVEIIETEPNKYLYRGDSPELVAAEVERRISAGGGAKSKEQETIDELKQQVEELTARIEAAGNRDEGIGSVLPRKKAGTTEKLTDAEQMLVNTMKDQGVADANIQSALAKYRNKNAR